MSDQRPLPAPPKVEAASSDPDISIEEGPVVHEPSRAVPQAGAEPPASSGAKKRKPMTLKIPDDEVSRPQTTPSAPTASPAVSRSQPVPAPSTPTPLVQPPSSGSSPSFPRPPDYDATPITAMRIISIDAPPVVPKPVPRPASVAPPSRAPEPAPGSSTAREDSWTPYQPSVVDPQLPPMRPRMPSQPPLPLKVPVEREGAPPVPAAAVASSPAVPHEPPTVPRAFVPPGEPSVPSGPSLTRVEAKSSDSMDEIPIVAEPLVDSPDSGEPLDVEAEGEVVAAPRPVAPSPSVKPAAVPAPHPSAPSPPVVPTHPPASGGSAAAAAARPPLAPIAPAAPAINIKDLPPMRALAPTEPEGLEVRFDEEEPLPAPRRPFLTEAPEIAPEDLVSVESAPSPAVTSSMQTPTPARAFIPAGGAAVPVRPSGSMPPPAPQKAATAAAPATSGGAARVMVPTTSPLAPPPMTDAAASGRRKARPWWEELFNDDFIRTMAKITDAQVAGECTFIEDSLGVVKGGMVLDLACGTGRHAIELTRRGYKVVGFDLSLPMLARAAEEAQERGQKLNFVQGDMREMTFEDTFDGVYSWATSFGFFEEEKNAGVVQRVHKALKKGGQFLLDVINRDYLIRQAPSLAWFEGDGCVCMDEMSIDWITSRMKVKRTMMMDDGRTKEIDYSVRVYSLHELGKMLHDCGFRVAEVSGRASTPGVFFGNESPRTLILAEKR